MGKNDERYAGDKFNTRSLLEAYQSIAEKNNNEFVAKNDTEFAAESDTEFAAELGQKTNKEKYVSGALMSTYAQMMDSYQEGTIDGQTKASKDEEAKLSSKSLDQELK
jgi:hypothetical protein